MSNKRNGNLGIMVTNKNEKTLFSFQRQHNLTYEEVHKGRQWTINLTTHVIFFYLTTGSHKRSKSANKTATNPKRLVLSTNQLQIMKWILCHAASQGLFYLLNQCFALLLSCRFNLLEVHVQCSILQLVCQNERSDNTDAKNEAWISPR